MSELQESKLVTVSGSSDLVRAVENGEIVVLVESGEEHDHGDLVLAASAATEAKVGFMLRHTSGIICQALEFDRIMALNLPMMNEARSDLGGAAFTISVDSVRCSGTGTSAADRLVTIRSLIDPTSHPDDFLRPGHMYPLRGQPGGVLRRPGHAEAAIDLAKMAGMYPSGLVAEVINEDGSLATMRDLESFSEKHGLLVGTIEDLIDYRRRSDPVVERISGARLPTKHGEFFAWGFQSLVDDAQHVALVVGDVRAGSPTNVSIHFECVVGDGMGSLGCNCGRNLTRSMAQIGNAGQGVVIYLRSSADFDFVLSHPHGTNEVGWNTSDAVRARPCPTPDSPAASLFTQVTAQMLQALDISNIRLIDDAYGIGAGLGEYSLELHPGHNNVMGLN